MKKLLALLLALAMLFTLCACNKEPVPEDGPGGLEDVSDPAIEEAEESPYPGTLPLGGETACGQIIEIPEEAKLEYLGSKVVADEDGYPILLSWFWFTNIGEYENSVNWAMNIYAYQNEEDLWATSYTYNDVVLDDTLYEEINAGEELEVCMAYELENFVAPVTFSFTDVFEEVEPMELTVDLAEVEMCMEVPEGIDGLYMATYLYAQDTTYEYDQLVEYGYADNSYVELYADGTGVLCVAGQAAELRYDEDCFYIGEETLYFTLEDDVLTVEGDDLWYEFAPYVEAEEPVEEEEENFVGETLTTDYGYVSITLDKGWYKGEPRSNYALTLYNDDLGPSKWVEILDLQLTSLEDELEYTHLALASAEYEEVTIGENTYQMLFDDTWGPQAYLVAETSTGKAFVVDVRNMYPEEVMTMLESIQIH